MSDRLRAQSRGWQIFFSVLIAFSILGMVMPPYFTNADLLSLSSLLFSISGWGFAWLLTRSAQ